MEERPLQDVLKTLEKSSDKSKSYKCLLCIRRHVDKKTNVKKLREYGGLEIIVQFLSRNKLYILDVTLSILGNCCLEFESAKEVIGLNIVKALGDILRSCKQDSIYGRVCRIIGNISQFAGLSKYFHINQSQIVTAIVGILASSKDPDSKITEATQLMAIRALRTVFHRQDGPYNIEVMETQNVVKTVTGLVVHYADDWVERREREVLLKACVRCISDLRSSLNSYDSLEQLLAGGDGIKSLVRILAVNPYAIVRIITQLNPFATTRSELEIPGLCKAVIDGIRNGSGGSEGGRVWPRDFVNALCLLCVAHRINCDEVRLAGGLTVLNDVLRNDPRKRFESVVLKAALAYIYDETSCAHVANAGFTETLIDKLTENYDEDFAVNGEHEFVRKERPVRKEIKFTRNQRRAIYEMGLAPDDYVHYLHQSSPRSSSPRSTSDTSGTSSPFGSPSHSNDLELTDDSENYSPVCSDNEPEEPSFESTENASNRSNSSTFHLDYDEPDSDQDQIRTGFEEEPGPGSDSMSLRNFVAILRILKGFSRLKPPVMELGKRRTLVTLLKFVLDNRYPRAVTVKVLSKLVGTPAYTLPLMQTDFVQTLYELTQTQHDTDCSVCYQRKKIGTHLLQRLSRLTECGGVKGDIAHCLLRGDADTKTKVLLAVPYIVKNKHTLQKIMLRCEGLTILMKLMEDASDAQKQSVKVLSVMASQNLRISSPLCPTSTEVLTVPEYKFSARKNPSATVVTFLLDDGARVQADRQFLSEKSDFFQTLLTGQFKESKEETIQLKNVTDKPFRLLMSLLNLELQHLVIKNVNVDVDTLLSAISLADRYMLVDLCVYLTRTVEQYKITTENVSRIYRWSLESGTNLLRVEAIAFALVGNVTDSERFDMFTGLFELGCSEHLIGDIRTLLVRYLNVHR